MTIQLSAAIRNARVNAIESTIGVSAKLQLRSGAQPATAATADSGTLLAEMTLPSDWMGAAASGVATLLGTWQDTSADAAGTVGHFRIKDSAGTTTGMQGSVTATGGGGDITLDNPVLAAGQQVTITAFTVTDGNP